MKLHSTILYWISFIFDTLVYHHLEEEVKSVVEEMSAVNESLRTGNVKDARPVDLLLPRMRTKSMDRKLVDNEHEVILDIAMKTNKDWTKDKLDRNRGATTGVDNGLEDDVDTEVVVWGDVSLSDDELALLRLGPGYMVVSKLDREEMAVEENVSMTKMRWSRRNLGTEEMTGRQADIEAENEDPEAVRIMEAIEIEARDVISSDGTNVDMRRKRATDMRGNRMVYMPGPDKPIVEAENSTRIGVWDKTFALFMKDNCKDDGTQLKSNLSRSQTLGLRSLSRRVAKVEIVVLEADKGKKFVVVDEATYKAMALDHMRGDIRVSREGVRDSQRILSSTAKSLANMVSLGSAHSQRNYVRCLDNCGSQAEDVPTLRLLPKVHKPPGDQGHLQSRPVVTAAAGLSARAGDQVADILEPMVSLRRPRMEDLSSEEVLSQLRETQEEIARTMRKDTVVGSLDVRGLYPSLDQEGSSEAVARFVRDSSTTLEGIDWRHTQIFVASNMDPHELKREGVLGLVPKRCKKFGPRPGRTTEELSQKRPDPRSEKQPACPSKWAESNPDKELSEENRRLLLSVALKIATRTIFRHHCYQFNGEVFRQAKGGPIGLRVTSVVARIVMDDWFTRFLGAILAAGIEVHGAMKYVDDVNLILAMVDLGTRWVSGSLVHEESWRLEDESSGRTRCDVTMEAVRTAADSIVPWLDFTVDHPGLHDNGMVPILDMQVWVRHPDPGDVGGHDTLGWLFYEKPTSSSKVLRATSAYNWRSKLVTLNMEVFRRMRNSSRQLTVQARADLLSTFVKKLRMSGYVEKTVEGILHSGLTFYTRKVKIELDGGPPLNARSEEQVVQKRRQKMGAKESWFQRRRGGQEEVHQKEHGWRKNKDQGKDRTPGGRSRGRKTLPKYSKYSRTNGREEGPGSPWDQPKDVKVVTTLLVPYTIGSALKDRMQGAEDNIAAILGGGKVRIVEKGGTSCLTSSVGTIRGQARGYATTPAV